MKKYLVVIEKAEDNYAAFSPDVLGCIATGSTVEETTKEMKEALQFHIESLDAVPEPKGRSWHIADGIVNKDEVAEEYFITEVEVFIPHHA